MKTALDFLNDGNKKIVCRDFAGAFSNFSESIAINPDEATTYINRGFARGKLNDLIGGIADFTNALEIDPDDDVVQPRNDKNKTKRLYRSNSRFIKSN